MPDEWMRDDGTPDERTIRADLAESYQLAYAMAAHARRGDRASVLAALRAAKHPSLVAWALARAVGDVALTILDEVGAQDTEEQLARILSAKATTLAELASEYDEGGGRDA